MPSSDFVHLHLHTEFSLLDGASRCKDIAQLAAEYGMPAVAMTDHGAMYGTVDFYSACQEVGVKPILGLEAYLAPRTRFDREGRQDGDPWHLTLLAENETGYRHLMKLTSASFLEGFYYKPRLDKEILGQYREGIIAFSGCLGGEIPQAIVNGQDQKAEQLIQEYADLFGPDHFYLELMDHGVPEQQKINRFLVDAHRRLGLPLVATNDVHYTKEGDAKAHDILLCIQTGRTISDPKRMKMATNQLFFRSPDQMRARFGELPEALRNTLEIAERCNVHLQFGDLILPDYEVPPGHTVDSYLRELCHERLPRFYPHPSAEVWQRLEYELEVIQQKGYSGYFLIVWDFVDYAKRRGIRVGPGRGSGAGSLVAYVLGITELDPLRYDLFFERFLNPERPSPPDFDIDFPPERREEVMNYVVQKYGADKTAKIVTFGTLRARAALRDVGRALEIPLSQVDELVKLIPDKLGITLKQALNQTPELRHRYEEDPLVERLFDTAQTLEGLARHTSVHAAALVITKEDLTHYVPLAKMPSDGSIVTQFEMSGIKKIGLLKMDFLGLETMTVLEEAVNLVRETEGVEIDLRTLPTDDQATFDLIARGDVIGVFQLGETSGFQRVCMELKPDCLEDIIALVALFRPGPMEFIPEYVACKHGRKKPEYLHPSLEPILKETYGIPVYQEQIMQIFRDLGGFSLGEADLVRRAIGEKDREKMDQAAAKFRRGCQERGLPPEVPDRIVGWLGPFANYSFNKSHAAAYALVSYWTAYLKAHYPLEFMAARLTSAMEKRDKIREFIQDCRRMGIPVRPPCVNRGGLNFSVDGGEILYGLAAIKGVGRGIVEAIVEARQEGPFTDLYDLCERVDTSKLTKAALELLIRAGACSALGNRAQLLKIYETAFELGQKAQKDKESGQGSLFGGRLEDAAGATANRIAPPLPAVPEVSRDQLVEWELDLLGEVLFEDPTAEIEAQVSDYVTATSRQLREMKHGAEVIIGGQVTSARVITTRHNTEMMFVTLTDSTGPVEVTVFNKAYKQYGEFVQEGGILLVKGTVDKEYQRGQGGDERDEAPKVLGSVLVPPEEAQALKGHGLSRLRPAEPTGRTEPASSTRQVGNSPAGGSFNGDPFAEVDEPFPFEPEPPPADLPAATSPPAPRLTALHLRLTDRTATTETVEKLRGVLEAHPGTLPVYLHLEYPRSRSKIALGDRFLVSYSPDLCRELEQVLGPGKVQEE